VCLKAGSDATVQAGAITGGEGVAAGSGMRGARTRGQQVRGAGPG
jgi:hypothetical protein